MKHLHKKNRRKNTRNFAPTENGFPAVFSPSLFVFKK